MSMIFAVLSVQAATEVSNSLKNPPHLFLAYASSKEPFPIAPFSWCSIIACPKALMKTMVGWREKVERDSLVTALKFKHW